MNFEELETEKNIFRNIGSLSKRLEKAIDEALPGFLDQDINDESFLMRLDSADISNIFSHAELVYGYRQKNETLPDFSEAEEVLIVLHMKNPGLKAIEEYCEKVHAVCPCGFILGVRSDESFYADIIAVKKHNPPAENLIFLDVDGVLNYTRDQDLLENSYSKSRVSLFDELVESSDAQIVVISSRGRYKEERILLEKIIDSSYYDILYMTDYKLTRHRDESIEWFISHSPAKNYVILDDIDDGYKENAKLRDHFVEITHGFDEKCLEEALSILKK